MSPENREALVGAVALYSALYGAAGLALWWLRRSRP